jgi:hypothetical protein
VWPAVAARDEAGDAGRELTDVSRGSAATPPAPSTSALTGGVRGTSVDDGRRATEGGRRARGARIVAAAHAVGSGPPATHGVALVRPGRGSARAGRVVGSTRAGSTAPRGARCSAYGPETGRAAHTPGKCPDGSAGDAAHASCPGRKDSGSGSGAAAPSACAVELGTCIESSHSAAGPWIRSGGEADPARPACGRAPR